MSENLVDSEYAWDVFVCLSTFLDDNYWRHTLGLHDIEMFLIDYVIHPDENITHAVDHDVDHHAWFIYNYQMLHTGYTRLQMLIPSLKFEAFAVWMHTNFHRTHPV